MFDVDHTTENQHSVPCRMCDEGAGVFCDEQSGDWICENCGHNYSRPDKHSTTKAKLEGKEVMGITVAKLEADNDKS